MEQDFILIQKLNDIYSKLEDQESRDVFLARVNYIITKDFKYMADIVQKYIGSISDDWIIYDTQKDFFSKEMLGRGIIVYGAGDDAKRLLEYYAVIFPEIIQNIKYLVDRNHNFQANGKYGFSVKSPEYLLKNYNNEFIFIATSKYEKEVKQWFVSNELGMDNIVDCSRNKEYSNRTYLCNSFTEFKENEVFLDCGACDLTTSIDFLKLCPNTKKIYAFEAEKRAYQICCEVKKEKNLDCVKVLPYACWSHPCELSFENRNLGSSLVRDEGDDKVLAMPLDSIIDKDDKVTFIKMDIEGAELEALMGAKEIIKRDKPKLAICIYHKTEDIWEIPFYIMSLVSEYKLYIRHHSTSIWDTVLYAVY